MITKLEIPEGTTPLVVNFFGGPGVGKSAMSYGVSYYLKRLLVNMEYVPEYAKELVWEDHSSLLEDQVLIFAKQHRRIKRLLDKVDVVVTDSPLMNTLMYQEDKTYNSLKPLVFEAWNSCNNLNIFLERSTEYQAVGREQTENQAIEIDQKILKHLDDSEIPYERIRIGDYYDASIHIVDTIIKPVLLGK